MRQNKAAVCGTVLAVCATAAVAYADVAIVIEHQYTIGNDRFSCFAYNSLLDPHEFITTGYGFGKDLRWSRVLDDSVEPWIMEGQVLMNTGQIEFFARDGFASYSLTFDTWGMNFNPLDEKYFIECLSLLRDPFNNNERVESERDLIQFDPRLPNSVPTVPSGVTVANSNGIYSLVDGTFVPGDGFISAGTRLGDQLTLYPLHYTATIAARTYTITNVVSENELWLDQDPTEGYPETSESDVVGYILMMQPWLTLADFRRVVPYYGAHDDISPKANKKGGLSPDGTILYIPDQTRNPLDDGSKYRGSILAVDTQVRGQMSVYMAGDGVLCDYVTAQRDTGRLHPIVNPDRAYKDGNTSYGGPEQDWSNVSSGTTIDWYNTVVVSRGSRSIEATYTVAGATLDMELDPGKGRSVGLYSDLMFSIHGGTAGGQTMTVEVYNSNGTPGTPVVVTPPAAGTWTDVEIPISQFGLTTWAIGGIVFQNTAGGAQPTFYLDDVGLKWKDPLPPGVGAHDPAESGVQASDMYCDAEGRLWLTESETDDLIWTTNGINLHTFLTSNEIEAAYVAAGEVDPWDYFISNGVQLLGLIVDDMGTVYWSDNQARSIWKAPAIDPANNIIRIASSDEIKAALGLVYSPRGLSCFSIRGTELLTYNFVESNTVYKVDLNTHDYGDFDGDFDADLADYATFQECFMRDLSNPDEPCHKCDFDADQDVDLGDFAKLATFLTGPGG